MDAVVNTTVLHWLPAGALVELYLQLGDLVRPGGGFLNGDFFGFAPYLPSFTAVSERRHARWSAEAAIMDIEDWETCWAALRRQLGIEPLFVERGRRFNTKTCPRVHSLVEVHLAALHNAGFHEVGVIWQHLDSGPRDAQRDPKNHEASCKKSRARFYTTAILLGVEWPDG